MTLSSLSHLPFPYSTDLHTSSQGGSQAQVQGTLHLEAKPFVAEEDDTVTISSQAQEAFAEHYKRNLGA